MPVRLTHEPGERLLKDLVVVTVLGSGAHGTVYRCRDLTGGPDQAVKEMHVFLDPVEVERATACFGREAEHLGSLDHPRIPRARRVDVEGPHAVDPTTGLPADPPGEDTVWIPRRLFLVTEHVPGRTLEDLLRDRSEAGELPDAATVAMWIDDLAEVLGYLHGQGLVHRDVKPANILIRNDDKSAVLLDYGLLREIGEVPGYGTVPLSESGRVGTPGYAPPDPVEQENPGPASDQHALAMSARRVLTGFDPTRPEGLAVLRGRSMLELRPDLAAHFASALDRGIRPAAEDRWESVAAFAAALESPAAPLAGAPQTSWLELRPESIDAGPIAPGQLRDLTLTIRDRRVGVRPTGYAASTDDRLRILPATARGADILLHLVLRVPRNAAPGPVRTRLTIGTDEEERVVPITYLVDRDARGFARPGCWALPLVILRSGHP